VYFLFSLKILKFFEKQTKFIKVWSWGSITKFLNREWHIISLFVIIFYIIMYFYFKIIKIFSMFCIWCEFYSLFLQKFMLIKKIYIKIWKFYNIYNAYDFISGKKTLINHHNLKNTMPRILKFDYKVKSYILQGLLAKFESWDFKKQL